MSPGIKVALAAAGGSFLAQWIEPQLAKVAANLPDPAKKAVGPAAIGIGAYGIWWALGKGG